MESTITAVQLFFSPLSDYLNICLAQSENRYNSEIFLRNVGTSHDCCAVSQLHKGFGKLPEQESVSVQNGPCNEVVN